LWTVLVGTLTVLALLHVRMDQVMDTETMRVAGREGFRGLHRWYLRVSTLQWAASVALSWWTILATSGFRRVVKARRKRH
jgi:hypothetical protein